MLAVVPLAALNHLIGAEDWARKHLAPFSGQTVSLQMPPLALCLEISPEGLFRRAVEGSKATVTLTLPADLPLRILSGKGDRAALLSAAQISGSADLADCLGFVFRNLSWDVEADLAPVVGDIAAHRLVQGARAFASWQSGAFASLTRNVTDYLSEERPVLVKHHEVAAFDRELSGLATRLASVEKRIGALEAAAPLRSAR